MITATVIYYLDKLPNRLYNGITDSERGRDIDT